MKATGSTFIGGLLVIMSLAFTQSEKKPKHTLSNDSRLFAATWFGLSAENKACYRQGYRMAELALEKTLTQTASTGKPLAIVTDLDETVLDNSAWAFRVMLDGKDYPHEWENWEKAGKAPAFPGAVDFFQKAANQKVEVFYISNRLQKNVKTTIENLQKLGLPFADEKHILLKTTESNKVARRNLISKDFEIVLLLGDNLADFDGVWEEAAAETRSKEVYNHDKEWGTRFIIFPNPVYGGWKETLFDHKRNWNASQTDSIWRAKIGAYNKAIGF